MNVLDQFKHTSVEEINRYLESTRNPFSVLCTNLENDFNIATVIRNANAFNAKEVIIFGRKQYDRRGTVGTHHYVNLRFFTDLNELEDYILQEMYYTVAFENLVDGSEPLDRFRWDKPKKYKNHLMIFGQERNGIPPEILEGMDRIVYIPQHGSVRSMNVGTASGIAMYDFCAKTSMAGLTRRPGSV